MIEIVVNVPNGWGVESGESRVVTRITFSLGRHAEQTG